MVRSSLDRKVDAVTSDSNSRKDAGPIPAFSNIFHLLNHLAFFLPFALLQWFRMQESSRSLASQVEQTYYTNIDIAARNSSRHCHQGMW